MTPFALQRIYYPDATEGVIYCNGVFQCVTMELPWDDNQPDKSCIPEGAYHVIRHDSADHPNTWEITGVPSRTEILIHNGNKPTQSLGCILVGNTYGTLDGQRAVLNSVVTMAQLNAAWPDEFDITIYKHSI